MRPPPFNPQGGPPRPGGPPQFFRPPGMPPPGMPPPGVRMPLYDWSLQLWAIRHAFCCLSTLHVESDKAVVTGTLALFPVLTFLDNFVLTHAVSCRSSDLACPHRVHSQVASLPGPASLQAPSRLAQASRQAAHPSSRWSLPATVDNGCLSTS